MPIRYIPFLWRFQKPDPDTRIQAHSQAWRLYRLRMTPDDLNRSLRAQLDRAGVGGLAAELEQISLPDRIDQKQTQPHELPSPTRLDKLMSRNRRD